MASVIRFLKKIKPFKRCVTNPSQISFDRQNENLNVKRQKSLDDNYYKAKYSNNGDHNLHTPETLTDDLSNKADIDSITPTSCPSKFTFSETANQIGDLVSTCCTKASSYYNNTNDDGLKIEPTETMTMMLNSGQYQHMIHESTPFFNTNKYINNELNTELKYALQETIPYDDLTVATKLSAIKSNSKINIKRCGNSGNSTAKTSTLMNGTYTVGNKMKIKNNSIKSTRKSYRFFLRSKYSVTSKEENEKIKPEKLTPPQQQQQQQQQNYVELEQNEKKITCKNDGVNEDENIVDDNISTHSDSLCDPLFSSTLKSSSSAVCDDSSIRLEKKLQNNQNDMKKAFENGMNTVTLTKTALRKFLVKNHESINKSDDNNVSSNAQMKELNPLNNLHENMLFDNSLERMRRSVSLPGMNDPLSPIVGNLSKISTIKDADEIELSNHLQVNNLITETSSNIPSTKTNSNSNVVNNETFDANLYSLNVNGEHTSEITKGDMKFTEDLLKTRVKHLASAFKEIRNINGKQINRSKSLLENTNNFNEFCSIMINRKKEADFVNENCVGNFVDVDDENTRLSGYQNRFIRGGTHKIRMSKTIKQMFKNVVKYQMNALNCLEKFYEAQVLKLETDRRRDLTLNPECKEYIKRFYDLQLSQLEERVYSNLSYICRNRCNGCNIGPSNNTSHCTSQSNLMLNNSKMTRMAQMIMQQHQHQQQIQQRGQSSVHETNHLKDNSEDFFPLQPHFKRQFSLPYQCKSSQAYQLPPHPPNYTSRFQMQQKLDQQQQLNQLAANRNTKKFSQKSGSALKGKYTKQNPVTSNGSTLFNDFISSGNNNINIRNTLKKYSQKRLNTNLNYSTSTETLNSISLTDQINGSNLTRSTDHQGPVKRQIKSASSLQAVDENEQQIIGNSLYTTYNNIEENKINQSGVKKQNKMLTNGSLTMALQNSTNLSKTSSNYLLNSIDNNNEFSTSTASSSVFLSDKQQQQPFEHPLLRLSDSFQTLKFSELFSEQPITSSPTNTRRHTYGADKYFHFKNIPSNHSEQNNNDNSTIDSKRQKQINSLKETQV